MRDGIGIDDAQRRKELTVRVRHDTTNDITARRLIPQRILQAPADEPVVLQGGDGVFDRRCENRDGRLHPFCQLAIADWPPFAKA
ncbi:hypothetical protein ACFPM0_21480 [Pseudonocardia sulfidoxydans]|uniref:hypothetical protein n=1 Tax=Pseudonocardia sulfidoxydans TaxID=54011 RepID=UPI00360C293E